MRFGFIVILLNAATAFSQNIDVEESSMKVIKPYAINRIDSKDRSIFFGYNIQLKAKKEDSQHSSYYVGAPYRTSSNPHLRATRFKFRNAATGGIFSCQVTLSSNTLSYCAPISNPLHSSPGNAYGMVYSYRNTQNTLMTCSPFKLRRCKYNETLQHTYPGYCYTSLNNGKTWNDDSPTRKLRCPPEFQDVIFLIDGSGSVKSKNFELIKNWVMKLSNMFDISSGKTRIGVVQYSHYFRRIPESYHNQKYLATEIALGEHTDRDQFNDAVRKISLQGFTTYTAAALRKVVHDFRGSSRFRFPNTSKILILLTDGKSTDKRNLKASASHVRDMGITTFAIGIGKAKTLELREVATGNQSSSKRVYYVSNFSSLDTISNQLINEIETAQIEGIQNPKGMNFGEYGFSMRPSRKEKEKPNNVQHVIEGGMTVCKPFRKEFVIILLII